VQGNRAKALAVSTGRPATAEGYSYSTINQEPDGSNSLIKRLLARATSALQVVASTRDVGVTLRTLQHDTPVAVSRWLGAGGTIGRGVQCYRSLRLHLPSEQWYCLGYVVDLVDAGAAIEWDANGTVSIRFPDGVYFELSGTQFASAVGVVTERFVYSEYSALNVAGNIVLDIGANIGDSAVYFARRGALRVYAYEPFPLNCDAARLNVRHNGVAAQVEVISAGVGNKRETLVADFDEGISPFLSLRGKPHRRSRSSRRIRQTVRMIPFADALRTVRNAHKGVPIVCKIDCEGSEFEILDRTLSIADVDNVNEFLVEYHRRPAPLVTVLTALGYDVRFRSRAASIGQLLATRP
jgi:FkbM family methyltransferase